MTDRYKEYAFVCHAIVKAMGAAQSWHQIQEMAAALMCVHLQFRLLDESCRRDETEACSSPTPDAEEE